MMPLPTFEGDIKVQAKWDSSQCNLNGQGHGTLSCRTTSGDLSEKVYEQVQKDFKRVLGCATNVFDIGGNGCSILPGANRQVTGTVKLNSWDVPLLNYFPLPQSLTSTLVFELSVPVTGTELMMTSTMNYVGAGYVFDVDNLYLAPGEKDVVKVGPGGKVITYTTDSGSVPDLYVGIEQPEADFGFTFHSFDMLPTDMVMLGIDTTHKQLDVRVDTIAESGNVIFDFEMVRIDDATEEIFESPEGGFDINNGEMLIIDYGSWQGGHSSLRVGYDANENGILDTAEELQWEDAPG
jgi:hypothetical protein